MIAGQHLPKEDEQEVEKVDNKRRKSPTIESAKSTNPSTVLKSSILLSKAAKAEKGFSQALRRLLFSSSFRSTLRAQNLFNARLVGQHLAEFSRCSEHISRVREERKVSISIFITPKAISHEYLICRPSRINEEEGARLARGFNSRGRFSSEILKLFTLLLKGSLEQLLLDRDFSKNLPRCLTPQHVAELWSEC